jgi:hypothetical protein
MRSRSSASSPDGTDRDPENTDTVHYSGPMGGRRAVVAVALMTSVALTAACGSSSPSSQASASQPATTTTEAPQPAGVHPSAISKMVCNSEAQREIAEALGLEAVKISTPTWVDHVYSCRYEYNTGVFSLSVKELSSWDQTLGYFHGLANQFGSTGSLSNLGQDAFSETDGSVVVRKDWKVLTVDITGLPDQFGVPPTSSGDIAVTVADVILGCWAGD